MKEPGGWGGGNLIQNVRALTDAFQLYKRRNQMRIYETDWLHRGSGQRRT